MAIPAIKTIPKVRLANPQIPFLPKPGMQSFYSIHHPEDSVTVSNRKNSQNTVFPTLARLGFAISWLLVAICAPGLWAQTPTVSLSLSSPSHGSLFDQASQTITGTLDPADATLTLDGQAAAVLPDGSFSIAVTLNPGLNTLQFKAEKTGHTATIRTLDLFLDQDPPTITITSPEEGAYLNRLPLVVTGRVRDTFDQQLILTRDGNPVTLTDGGFSDTIESLSPGTNTFSYQASDSTGHSQTLGLTVQFNDQAPVITLLAPGQAPAEAPFDITVAAAPAGDIANLSLYVGETLAYEGTDGTSHTHSETLPDGMNQIRVQAQATDIFGNTSTESTTISLARERVIYGQVLQDTTGAPLPGIGIQVETPTGTITQITGANGKYQVNVTGDPVTVRLQDAGYVPMLRRSLDTSQIWRVPDLRATARGTEPPGDMTVTPSGFTGTPELSFYGVQALPNLLPLGWSPVAGFHLDQVSGTGTLDWQAADTYLPPNGTFVLLFQQGEGWQILDQRPSDGFGFQWNNAEAGSYLVAIPDTWTIAATPIIGSTLVRQRTSTVAPETASQAETDPAQVSILDNPQTSLTHVVASEGGLPSGSQTRIMTQERHQYFHQAPITDQYAFDIFYYSYSHGDHQQPNRIGASIEVRARRMVDPQQTERASLHFTPDPNADDIDETPSGLIWELPGVRLDFSSAYSEQPIMDVAAVPAGNLPLIVRSKFIQAFTYSATTDPIQAPILTADEVPSGMAEAVLLRDAPNGWIYAGRLTPNGGDWIGGPGQLDLTGPGTYALVALADPVTELRGTVLRDAQAEAGAILRGDHFPWIGLSDNMAIFRYLVPQIESDQTVYATSGDQRHQGQLLLSATSGTVLLENQTIALDPVGFYLIGHTPLEGAAHVSLLPRIELQFNLPLTEDEAVLTANIALTDAGANNVPLQILPAPGRQTLHLVPTQALTASGTYTLGLQSGLRSWANDPYDGLSSITFTTRAMTVSSALDLPRFYLEWDAATEVMTLVGPAGAYASGTSLEVFVDASGYFLTTTLASGEYRHEVEALPGDVVTLVAVAPDGTAHRAAISRVVRSDGSLMLGDQAQTMALDAGTGLEVGHVSAGARSLFRIDPLDTAVMAALLGEVPSFVDGPIPAAVRGYTLTGANGEVLPDFSGQLLADLDPSTWPNGFLQLVAVVPDIMVPPDPTQPTQLQAYSFAYLMDVLAVLDGSILGEGVTPVTGGVQVPLRFDLGTAAYPIADQVHLILVHTASAAAKQATPASAKAAGQVPRRVNFRALRKNTEYIDPPPVTPAPWHISGVDAHPVPGAVIYQSLTVGGLPDLRVQGVTGSDGEAILYTYAPLGKLRGLDPATNELAYAGLGDPDAVTNLYGQTFVYSSVSKVTFDPANHLILTGQSPPPGLSVKWEVGTLNNDAFVPDSERTDILERLNRMKADDAIMLRVTATSDQAIADNPSPALVASSGGSYPPADLESYRAIFKIAPNTILNSAGLLEFSLTIANAGGQTTTVTRKLLVTGTTPPASKPGPPVLVTHLPNDGDTVPITETPYLAFSEPVTGVNSQTIRITRDGAPISLLFLDENGSAVGPTGTITECQIVPQQSLRLDSTYQFQVENLVDSEGESIQPHQSTFHTPEVTLESLAYDQTVQDMAGYRNLVLALIHDWAADGLQLALYDIREPREAMQLVWSLPVDLRHALRYRLALFTPDQLSSDLDPADVNALRDDVRSDRPLENLPVGTVAAVAYQRFGSAKTELVLLTFDGISFEPSQPFPLFGLGWPETSASLGRHLLLGFFQNEEVGAAPVRGTTAVYDLPALIRDYPALLERYHSRTITPLEFEQALHRVGIVAKYPLPGDVRKITTFFRKAENRYRPAMLISGAARPAIYPFDLNQQPLALGVPADAPNTPGANLEDDGVTPKYDGRMLAYTDYPDGPSTTKKGNGAVEQLTYFDPRTSSLKTSDFAIFSNYQDSGSLTIYELPESLLPTHDVLAPLIHMTIPEGVESLAVEPALGFVAITTKDGRYTVFELRAMLEGLPPSLAGTHFIPDGLTDPSVMFTPSDASMTWLRFHQGNLFAGDTQNQLNRLPLAPNDFREAGWEVYDLADWLNPLPQGVSTQAFHAKLAEAVVLYASDLVMEEDNTRLSEFVMELGTFDLEIRGKADVYVQIHALANDQIVGNPVVDIERLGVTGPKLEPFSTHGLATYFKDENRQKDLRINMYQAFRLSYRVLEGQRLAASGHSDFAVVYTGPKTRFQDPWRGIDSLDALTLMPDLTAVDYEVSSGHPWLSLSPSRVYNSSSVFQRGSYGVGMLSGQLLHMALPSWWRPKNMGTGVPSSEAAIQRIMLAQPGHFHAQYQIGSDGSAQAIDDLVSKFETKAGHWQLTQDDRVEYQFASGRQLPQLYGLFQKANAGSGQDASKLRFPLFRLASGPQAPGQLYAEVPLEKQKELIWENTLQPRYDNTPSTRPNQLVETVKDAANGHRTLTWSFEGSVAGKVIHEAELTPLATQLSYAHDSDGYLTEVRIMGERPMTYTWAPIGLTIGRLPIKRLVKIQQGNWFTQFHYEGPSDLIVSKIETPFGMKTLDVIREDSGLPETVDLISAIQDCPTRNLTFDEYEGQWLSASEKTGDLPAFTIAWTRKTNGNRARYLLASHGYRNQTYGYDERGRLIEYGQGGKIQYWTYHTEKNYYHIPKTFQDAENQLFEIDAAETMIKVKSGNDGERTTMLSGSGIPYGETDLLGMTFAAKETTYYTPTGLGFEASVGRPKKHPLRGNQNASMQTWKPNQTGDLEASSYLGVPTTFENYDDLGRPGRITTLDGVATTITYTFEGGLSKVIQTQGEGENALTQTSFYSARGNLIRQIQAFGGATVTTEYDYDDLGRLLSISEQAGADPLFTRYLATYDPSNLSSQPNRETIDGETLTYTLVEDFQPRITAVQRTVDGKSRDVNFATDALGRVIKSEMEGIGSVSITYDAFDRTKQVTPEDQGGGAVETITFSYGTKTFTVDNGFSDIQTTVTFDDDTGWSRKVSQSGSGLGEPAARTFTTSVIEESGVFGQTFAITESDGPFKKAASISATGHLLSSQYGGYTWQVPDDQRDRFGNPKAVTGIAPQTMTYDEAGRLTGLQDANGLAADFTYDGHFRLNGLIDSRDKAHTLTYIDASNDVKQVDITGQNVEGTPSVPTFSGSTTHPRTGADTKTWQGQARVFEETLLDTEIQITRTIEDEDIGVVKDQIPSTKATASLVKDPASGLLQAITNYIGEETQFNWSDYGRKLDIVTPGNGTYNVEFDGLGQLRKLQKGDDRGITIFRDKENRIHAIDTGTRLIQYEFTGPDLTQVHGGERPILLSNHNGQGQAQTIEIGDIAKMEVGYHPNGTPQNLVFGRLGGELTQIETNLHGDLQSIARDGQPSLTFTTNEWGAPATIQVDDGPVLELFSGDLQTLHLPANVTATLDREGRMKTIEHQGIEIVTIEYDADDRPTSKLVGDAVTEDYEYIDGYLYIKLTHDNEPSGQSKTGQNHDETQTFSRDGRGRITQVDSTLDGIATYDYVLAGGATPLPEGRHNDRIKTYTDPNGVVYHYRYSDLGYLSRIDIENGPTFAYSYDPAGNLLSVSVDAMAATFDNYQRGLPSDVSWVYEDQTEQSFTLTRTPNGRLQEIANGDYRLSLEWSADPAFSVSPMPMITKMTKKGPGMKEVWEPAYDAGKRLTGMTITRTTGSNVDAGPACGDCQTTVIEETYGSLNQLMTGLTRIVDGITVLDTSHTLDPSADQRRIGERQSGTDTLTLDYDGFGSITAMDFSAAVSQAFDLDGTRRPRSIQTTTSSGAATETYGYDPQSRRISRDDGGTKQIYAHHGSRVIAMGTQDGDGLITWTHAFGHGPLGPAFVRDLTHGGNDAFIFTDHLGTPFAYRNPVTDATTFTPFNPWGELLATTASGNPPWAGQGQVPTTGFTLAPDSTYTMPPLGLAGHLYDRETGLVQMHHRSYSPRLGQFLTPDYRAPDIYDPSTFTEPYAYAAGNPMLYWDPDGKHWYLFSQGKNDHLFWVSWDDNDLFRLLIMPLLQEQGSISEIGHHDDLIRMLGGNPEDFLFANTSDIQQVTSPGGEITDFFVDITYNFDQSLCPDCTPEELTAFKSERRMVGQDVHGGMQQAFFTDPIEPYLLVLAGLRIASKLSIAKGSARAVGRQLGKIKIPVPTIQTTRLNTATLVAGIPNNLKFRSLKLESKSLGEIFQISGRTSNRFLFSSNELAGVERASEELLQRVGQKRAITFADEGSDAFRFLEFRNAEAAAFGEQDIILRLNPSKAAVLEEFLHGTQQRLGLIDRIGRSAAERHVKDFMIRHRKLLGISPEDTVLLQKLMELGL